MGRDVQTADFLNGNSGLSTITNPNLLNKNSWDALSESTELFFKSLKLGRVRGVVCILDFPDFGLTEDSSQIKLTQELLNRDILVTVFNCDTVDINTAGVSGPDLFQSTGDGLAEFCDFIGIQPILYLDSTMNKSEIHDFYNGLALRAGVKTFNLPAATIAKNVCRGQDEIMGSIFTLEGDPEKTADSIDRYIHYKRMEIQWCDRCGGRFSPFS